MPRYGTCCISMAWRYLNSSAAPLLDVLPLPKDKRLFALLRERNEFGNGPGRKVRLTVSIIGIVMMPATGAKSALGS